MRPIPLSVFACFILYAPFAPGIESTATLPAAPFRSPYLPIDRSLVLQDVPAYTSPPVKRMRDLQASLSKKPKDLPLAVQLSNAYIDFGRQIGDAHYAGYAEAVIAPWLNLPKPPVAALVVHGVILQYQHQFDAARAQLQRALAADPGNQQALLTLSSIDMVQGEYAAAAKNCQLLVGHASLTVGVACLATVRSLVGAALSAQQMLSSIQADSHGTDVGIEAWLAGLRAEIAGRLGDAGQQEANYRKALQYAPDDDFLLVSYADFLLDQNRPGEVLSLLANQAQSDTAFLRIALAQQALKSPQVARYVWIMSARFEALSLRGSAVYDREHSRFVLHLLNDADAALDLARGNWQQQRAPWDIRVFFEAALAAGKPKAASEALALFEKTHLQDPIINGLAGKLRAQLAAGKSS